MRSRSSWSRPALTVLAGIASQAQYAFDRPWVGTVNAVVGMVAKVALVIVLTETSGITGAAVGFALGTLLQFGLQSADVARHLHGPARRWLPPRQLAGLVVAYADGFAAARALDQALTQPFGLLAGLAAGSLVFVVAYAWVGGLLERDRQRIAQARQPASARAGGRAALARRPVAAPTPCGPPSAPAPPPQRGSRAAPRGATRAGACVMRKRCLWRSSPRSMS